MTQRAVTAEEVARLAGVSQSAVSRAYTPGASIAAKTRDKILAAARELGYRPNAMARTLITNRSRIIGVVMAYLDNMLYPDVLEKLAAGLQERGYQMLLFTGFKDRHSDPVFEQIMQLPRRWAAARLDHALLGPVGRMPRGRSARRHVQSDDRAPDVLQRHQRQPHRGSADRRIPRGRRPPPLRLCRRRGDLVDQSGPGGRVPRRARSASGSPILPTPRAISTRRIPARPPASSSRATIRPTRYSSAAITWRSPSWKSPGTSSGCGCPTTSPSSATTMSARRAGRVSRSPPSRCRSRSWSTRRSSLMMEQIESSSVLSHRRVVPGRLAVRGSARLPSVSVRDRDGTIVWAPAGKG